MQQQSYYNSDDREAMPFVAMPAASWIQRAADRPRPVQLWSSLWFEGELACLFADTNMGKSIYAVQIADCISRQGKRVIYFDFEMSDKQFEMRYSDGRGHTYAFSPELVRAELSSEHAPQCIDEFIQGVEQAAEQLDCSIIIVDNITWLCNRCENGEDAGYLMQQLCSLKKRRGMSMLVLAHTPKREIYEALTQNSLAGSKRLANFMDSIFAIGRDWSTGDAASRYVKQIKVRSCECEYGESNVLRYVVEKDDLNLYFRHVGYGTERDMLSRALAGQSADELAAMTEQVMELRSRGLSIRDIARELELSRSKVDRILKRNP